VGRGLTPWVLLGLVGCRQLAGIVDTEEVSDAPTSRVDAGPTPDGSDVMVPDAPPGTIDAAADAMAVTCPVSYVEAIGTHRYRVISTTTTWAVAQASCAADGTATYLAIPDDDVENAQLAMVLGGESWIGVSDLAVEGEFRNVLGQLQLFHPWETGEPDGANQDCVAMRTDGGGQSGAWRDDQCTVLYRYVCECP